MYRLFQWPVVAGEQWRSQGGAKGAPTP